MEPEKKENTILMFLTYSLLGILMLVVSVLMYKETREPHIVQYDEPFTIPEIQLLTPEEVENEKLALRQANPIRITPTNSTNNEDIELEPALIRNNIIIDESSITQSATIQVKPQTSDGLVEVKKVQEIKADGTVIYTTEKVAPSKYSLAYATYDEDTFKKLSSTGETIEMAFTGDINAINPESGQLTLVQSNGSGLASVWNTSNTSVTINGKQMPFAQLRIGDKIIATGTGYAGTSHLKATSIALVGTFEIN
ncbi:MAG: hypothetical protein H6779_00175 [Candidatus Nomurabacteria bacterium]|nr:MAG: hypothetical protein H6779_00175 [Candidatus Nomurabacteria bacterium]